MPAPLLYVRNLTVRLRAAGATILDDVSFAVSAGETIGILGESGAGKTTLARAIAGLLPRADWDQEGSVVLNGTEVLGADERSLQTIRGSAISLISQEPETALNPVLSIGRQIDEVLRAHSREGRDERREKVREILAAVGLEDAIIYPAFAHQLSGGERQRVVLAQLAVLKPSLLIADEPTSALDTVTRANILKLLQKLSEDLKIALIFITHTPELLIDFAKRTLVMYGGRIVEEGSTRDVLTDPRHPYTRGLLRSMPALRTAPARKLWQLETDTSTHEERKRAEHSCSFSAQCTERMAACDLSVPPPVDLDCGRVVRCFRYES